MQKSSVLENHGQNQGQNMLHLLQKGHIIEFFAKDPQTCLKFIQFFTSVNEKNHSFAAENVGETPTASVQNHVLGVQNLQIHVLVNGFQGALVLHS